MFFLIILHIHASKVELKIPLCMQFVGLEVPSEMVPVRIAVHVSDWMPRAQQDMLHGLLATSGHCPLFPAYLGMLGAVATTR